MKADCIGKTMQCTKNPEGAAIGAAMMASVANGFFKDMDEAAEAMVELDDKIYEPDPTVKEAYDEAYARYLATYDAMEPVYDKLYKGE
jgi:xylulokinase